MSTELAPVAKNPERSPNTRRPTVRSDLQSDATMLDQTQEEDMSSSSDTPILTRLQRKKWKAGKVTTNRIVPEKRNASARAISVPAALASTEIAKSSDETSAAPMKKFGGVALDEKAKDLDKTAATPMEKFGKVDERKKERSIVKVVKSV